MAAILTATVGGLLSAYFYIEDSYRTDANRGFFILIVTAIVTVLLVGIAFSRYAFGHLRHHRPGYKCG